MLVSKPEIDGEKQVSGEDSAGKVIILPRGAPVMAQRGPDDKTRELVNGLRALWRRSQLSGRDDFDRACVLIGTGDAATVERYACAFFQGAQIFAHKRLRFFNAKAEAVSEDEMWLARTLQALHNGDYTSANHLMALRIAPAGRRRLIFLAQGLAERLFDESPAPAT